MKSKSDTEKRVAIPNTAAAPNAIVKGIYEENAVAAISSDGLGDRLPTSTFSSAFRSPSPGIEIRFGKNCAAKPIIFVKGCPRPTDTETEFRSREARAAVERGTDPSDEAVIR